MKSTKKFLCLLTAVVFAAFAVPSFGQTENKHFALGITPGTPDNNHQRSVVLATIINDNPSGSNASFGSFTLTVKGGNNVTIPQDHPADLDPDHGGQVTWLSPTSISVTNINPLKGTDSYTLTVYVSACGEGNPWSAVVYAGSNLNGGTFLDDTPATSPQNNDVACGVLACGGSVVAVNGVTSGFRSLYNKDGATCGSGDYIVTNRIVNNTGFLHFGYDVSNAVFYYAPPTSVTKLAWVVNTTGPIFETGLQCDQSNAQQIASPGVPKPYGTLISDNGGKIKVDTSTKVYNTPTTFPAGGFPIMIEQERMQVTKISGNTWTVTRPTGKTTSKQHDPTKLVMSTPFPIIPNTQPWSNYSSSSLYAPGNYARMCFPAGAGNASGGVVDTDDGWSSP